MAGFTDAVVTELSAPVHCGSQDDAYDFVTGLELSRRLIAELDTATVPAVGSAQWRGDRFR